MVAPAEHPPDRALRRAVAQLVEHRSPKPTVGGSNPSCPAHRRRRARMSLDDLNREQKRTLKRQGALNEKGQPTRAAPAPKSRNEPRTSPAQYLREVRDE